MSDVVGIFDRVSAAVSERTMRIGGGWRSMGELMLAIRVCIVPVSSVLIGLVLFYAIDQVHDLFLETFGTPGQGVFQRLALSGLGLWTLFYLCIIFGWVLPVYLSSRWLLARYNTIASDSLKDALVPVEDWVRHRLPAGLGTLCFLAVLIGQYQAIRTTPEVVWNPAELREALDKLRVATDNALGGAQATSAFGLAIVLFMLLLIPLLLVRLYRWIPMIKWWYLRWFAWLWFAMLALFAITPYFIFYTIFSDNEVIADWLRTAKDYLPEMDHGSQIVTLYVLAAVPFVLWFLRRIMPSMRSSILRGICRMTFWIGAMASFVAYMTIIGVVYVTWAQFSKSLSDPFAPIHLAILPLATMLLAWGAWRVLNWHDQRFPVRSPPDWPYLTMLLVTGVAIGLFTWLDPLKVTTYLNRAPLLAVALGVWVPVLTFVSLGSIRLRTPFIMAALAVLTLLGIIVGDTYDVRKVASRSQEPGFGVYSIDDSLAQWAKANDCTLPERSAAARAKAPAPANPCPQPLIILAAGGASRASFFTTAVLGRLMDEHGPGKFANRIYAISGVSGGALGGVTFQAALADSHRAAAAAGATSGQAPLLPPCRDTGTTDRVSILTARAKGQITPTKDKWWACMMRLQAGDFLSPTIVSLLFADLLNFGFRPDRAATLEHAWEKRYRDVTGKDTLQETLLRVRPPIVDKGGWIPHLLLNGTSVTTGRRIIATDFYTVISSTGEACVRNAQGQYPATCYLMFKDAYDFHDLIWYAGELRHGIKFTDSSIDMSHDFRLSTGATLSARFPVLSPHGAVRDAKGRLIERVVDGGYFENNGALTASDLAETLRARGLRPAIVLITNEPSQGVVGCATEDAEKPELPRADRVISFSLLNSPLRALLGTREARGTLASVSICRLVRDQDKDDFVHFRVKPQPGKVVSMSWWLSNSVQLYLGGEALVKEAGFPVSDTNREAYERVRRLMTAKPPPPPEASALYPDPR